MIMQPAEVALDNLIKVNFYRNIDQILMSVRKMNENVEVEDTSIDRTDVS